MKIKKNNEKNFVMRFDLSDFDSYENFSDNAKLIFRKKNEILGITEGKRNKNRMVFMVYKNNFQYDIRLVFKFDVTNVENEQSLDKSLDTAYFLGTDNEHAETMFHNECALEIQTKNHRLYIYKDRIDDCDYPQDRNGDYTEVPNPLPF